ncbi:hypothetical protein ND748_24215 [Frankia sp. AiPs1]|uniref:hypothetical protein n=1 Tax=Frankia sp. AiPs1 TaxID=573493 RepID=UPI0020430B9D|nr:hypothetical protein [Frankia sp. AiPs1]MCM3924755.1 hypothetical protein [Frankia sp. AiPs1]
MGGVAGLLAHRRVMTRPFRRIRTFVLPELLPSRPASPAAQAKRPAQDRTPQVQNPRQASHTHEAGDGRGPETGAVLPSAGFTPALHEQVTRVAEATAGRLAEPLQVWLTQQYGENRLAAVNDNRRKAGKPAGRDLRDRWRISAWPVRGHTRTSR